MANPITFDYDTFVEQYPEFSNEAVYTEAALTGYFDNLASVYIDVNDYGCYMLTGNARVTALNLLTAHIAKLFVMLNAGQTPGLDKSAREDKIEIEVIPPPTKSMFDYWLAQTGYGQMLLALLNAVTAGGLYVGVGAPERAAFRKAGGRF